MGVFVDYPSNPFSNLKNVETTILTANTHPITVEGILVTNRTSSTILINLKKVRTQLSPVTNYMRNNYKIEPYESKDIIGDLGYTINLEYQDIPSISDSLVIFSNGYNQIFDCDISYIRLNDLPLPPAP